MNSISEVTIDEFEQIKKNLLIDNDLYIAELFGGCPREFNIYLVRMVR